MKAIYLITSGISPDSIHSQVKDENCSKPGSAVLQKKLADLAIFQLSHNSLMTSEDIKKYECLNGEKI